MRIFWTTTPLLFSLLIACGGQADNTQDMSTDMSPQTDASQDMPTTDMDPGEDMKDMDTEDALMDMSTDMPTPAGVPTNAAELFPWLQAKNYASYPAEPAIHNSAGPHGGNVRTFVNDALHESIKAGNTQHPVGAASVKELYSGDTLRGWAVEVKVSDTQNNGSDWYWYEIFSITDNSNPVADGNGVGLCANCHSGGTDFVLTTGPFE